MKKHFLFLALTCVGFISCQKEIAELPDEPELPVDTTGTTNNKLLEKLVTTYGPEDSVATWFYYDAKGKAIKIKDQTFGEANENVGYSNEELRFYRNDKGKIERLVKVKFYYQGFDLQRTDSSIFEIFHNPANGQYLHAIRYTVLEYYNPTKITRDSIAYHYNAQGQMELVQVFRKDEQTDDYFEAKRNEFTYNNKGSIIKIRTNENYDNTGDPLSDELIPEYDDKINPWNLGDESLLTDLISYGIPGPHNPTKQIYGSEASEYVYTYNQFDLPETMTYKEEGTGTIRSISKFYYK